VNESELVLALDLPLHPLRLVPALRR